MQRSISTVCCTASGKDRNQRHSGDLLNRLERDVTDVVNAVTETAPSIIAVCIRLVGAFLFLYSMDASLACLTMAHHSALHGIEQGLYETYAQTDPRNQEHGQPYPKHTARNDTTPDGCTDLGTTVRYGTTVR